MLNACFHSFASIPTLPCPVRPLTSMCRFSPSGRIESETRPVREARRPRFLRFRDILQMAAPPALPFGGDADRHLLGGLPVALDLGRVRGRNHEGVGQQKGLAGEDPVGRLGELPERGGPPGGDGPLLPANLAERRIVRLGSGPEFPPPVPELGGTEVDADGQLPAAVRLSPARPGVSSCPQCTIPPAVTSRIRPSFPGGSMSLPPIRSLSSRRPSSVP